MKLAGRHGRHARLRMQLDSAEIALLGQLLDELDATLDADGDADGDADDPVLARLCPAAYPDDGSAEAEYRSLTESSLRADRHERIAACRADLHGSSEVDLADADDARRWIQVLNDLRLALGTRLGVSEEAAPEVDVTDPEQQPWLIYYWLTAVQDAVVATLMR